MGEVSSKETDLTKARVSLGVMKEKILFVWSWGSV